MDDDHLLEMKSFRRGYGSYFLIIHIATAVAWTCNIGSEE